ncbi:enoyl-CoA hydratase [Priestia koreensis]|uniref:enoyl-CoA hydratase n=1 Tax=Priestia koreensis TaxID=284581 RepID=UPI003458EE1E
MAVETKLVELTYEDRVATMILNRADALNALNLEMLKEVLSALQHVKEQGTDFLVIKGSGKAFSAGGDIKMMLAPSHDESFGDVMGVINQLITTLYQLPTITIAAVNGAAAGLGLSLALACDYIIADERAKLAMNFIGIALIPDGGGHFLLEKRMGAHEAKKLIWEGEVLTAQQGLEKHIIDETASDLDAAVEQKVGAWKKKPVLAMKKTKDIYVSQSLSQLKASLEMEKEGQGQMNQTKDHREGIEAFVQKRPPVFTGQ